MQVSRLYGCVTMMTTLCTGGFLIYRFLEQQQRITLFNDNAKHFNHFSNIHKAEIGGDLPLFGMPDDGNGSYMKINQYSDWYIMAVN